MRHSVGRPATGMGGGTKNPMERLCQPPSEPAFALYREQLNTAPPDGAKFVDNASHRETHFSLEIRLTVGHISQSCPPRLYAGKSGRMLFPVTLALQQLQGKRKNGAEHHRTH